MTPKWFLLACWAWAAWTGSAGAAEPPPPLALAETLDTAIRNNAAVLLQAESVKARLGQVLVARGQFEPRVSMQTGRNWDRMPLRRDEVETNVAFGRSGASHFSSQASTYLAGLSRQLETGHTVSGNVSVARTDDGALRQSSIPPQTRTNLFLTYRIPLLRNAGRDVVTANLRAAETDVTAARFETVATLEAVVRRVALGYYDVGAQATVVELARQSERRAASFLEELRRLVAADQVAAAELELASATQAARRNARIGAEQGLAEAQLQLARSMGAADALERVVAGVDTRLPALGQPALDSLAPRERITEAALSTRADLQALRAALDSAVLLSAAAQNGVRPEVDLTLTAGRVGRQDNVMLHQGLRPLGENGAGAYGGVTLSIDLPLRPSEAQGILRQRLAQEESARVRLRDSEIAAVFGLEVAEQVLRASREQLGQAREAVLRYETALRQEMIKRRLGASTVIDVINIETRLLDALLAEVGARQNHAAAIVNFGFEAGRLVTVDDDRISVNLPWLLDGQFDWIHQ